jgi:predicted anti-sigma-YlaC factor YlaD
LIDEDPMMVQQHSAACTSCRNICTQLSHLHAALSTLPDMQASSRVTSALSELAAATAEQTLTCDHTLELLEAWRAGELDAATAFLVEDHLLWCEACSQAAEAAEILSEVLLAMPELASPAAVAERIAHARLPWWQRLLPAPLPNFTWQGVRTVGALAAAAAVFAVFVSTQRTPAPPVATTSKPTVTEHVLPTDIGPVSAAEMATPPAAVQPASAHAPVVRSVHRVKRVQPVRTPEESIVEHAPTIPVDAAVSAHKAPAVPAVSQPVTVSTEAAPAVTVPSYVYAARDAVLNAARNAELSDAEEAASALPDTVTIAMTPRRPEVRVTSMPVETDSATARAEELRRLISEDLRRKNAPPKTAPIVVRTESAQTHDGVLFTIQ